jgi:hypothetical protein
MRIRAGFQISAMLAVSLSWAMPAALSQTTTEPELKSPAELWPDPHKSAEPGADLKPLNELLQNQPHEPELQTPDTLFPSPRPKPALPDEPLKPLSELPGEREETQGKPSAADQSVSKLLKDAPPAPSISEPKSKTDFNGVSKALREQKQD